MKESSPIYTLVNLKCPRCRNGNLFEGENPFIYKKIFKMHKRCSHCGLNYEIEPGFFYGAMYVSYGLTIAICIAVLVAMYVLSLILNFEVDFYLYIIMISITLLAFAPYLFRFSRALWLKLFIPYDPDKKGDFKKAS